MSPPDATLAADARNRHPMTAPVPFRLGDRIELRRPHPCGGRTWDVDRLGADLGLHCTTCGRRVLIERRRVERRLVAFATRGPEDGGS
jgi:hypothetical protein